MNTGTVVRYNNGRGIGAIPAESVGKVVRTDPNIGWPVVYFPWTHGPYSEFACSPSTLTEVPVTELSERERFALGV